MAEKPAFDFAFLSGEGLGKVDEAPALAVGDRVRVLAADLTLFHVPGHTNFNPKGLEGSVVKVLSGTSANLPVVVGFEEPRKFRAHFQTSELERV